MAAFIVAGSCIFAIAFAEWFRAYGERKWARMTDKEKLKAIAKWRSVG